METLSVQFENCFGISKLNHNFDFREDNVNTLYARNGLMKTSFTKVFEYLMNSKQSEIRDAIFDAQPVIFKVDLDGETIKPDEIFVINSYVNHYETDNLGDLLINNNLKHELKELHRQKNSILKMLEKMSGIKISKILRGKKIFELEAQIIKDLNLDFNSLTLNLRRIIEWNLQKDFSEIKYADIFSETAMKIIVSDDFQKHISDFLENNEKIYQEFNFLSKGNFGIGKLKSIEKEIGKNSFFVNDNYITLSGDIEIKTSTDLKKKIKEVEERIFTSDEFRQLEKDLSSVSGRLLKEVIENNPEIVNELRLENLSELKRTLWISYFKKIETEVKDIERHYESFEHKIKEAKINQTPWETALQIFESRFSVPYKMEIENIRSAVIGESIPQVKFAFCKDGNVSNENPENWVRVNREQLESHNTLSQGEKRALYLLNIIFDIEKLKLENRKVILIVDDIADSFDYKNKYAIIEYLKEISELDNFRMIILSHNFDFYRTVSSRLNVKRDNRLMANKKDELINIEREHYQDKPFVTWKKSLNKKHTIALIPFIRNIVEYSMDKQKNSHPVICEDLFLLTNLLHYKKHTETICIMHLKSIYREYLGNDKFIDGIEDEDNIYNLVLNLADCISLEEANLEDKIILAIGIRLISEKYMIQKISEYTEEIEWRARTKRVSGSCQEFLNTIDLSSNQTRRLYEAYIQLGDSESISTLNKVNIMTPEMIHINSFMYEPILDMDIVELKKLYNTVKSL